MIDHGPKNLLGVKVDAIDYEAAFERILRAAKARQGLSVSALAVHGVMTGVLDPVHRYRLNHLDLSTPDGQPVRWALNWLYDTQLPERVYGPDLMLGICERAQQENLPIYLYGSRVAVLQAMRANLTALFPRLEICGASASLFRRTTADEKEHIAQKIRASGAAITFVGLGCPRQEVWAYEYRDALSMPVIAVGAAFDFHAGALPQAPATMQRIGLEWLYRLISEPKRLWKRYLPLNPLFLWLLLLQKTGMKQFDPELTVLPAEELRYG